MIKRILVPTDGSEQSMVGVRYAAALAAQCGARISGLHVIDIKLLEGPFLRDISASLGTAPYVNYQGNISLILEERGKASLDALRHECEQKGVYCETSQVTGIIHKCIIDASELADLIVIGRGGEHSEWLEGLVGSTTQAVVRRAKQPVLVTDTDTPGFELFVLAYDGSTHAKRALQTAANISSEWNVPFHVLVVGANGAQAVMEEARAYLDTHKITAQYVAEQGDPSEVIVEYARKCGANLLVMGAYGHTKVRELVVGSTTVYALNHAPCPLLLLR